MQAFTTEERREWLKSQSLRASSAAIIVSIPDGRIITVKASYKNFWSIPGGMIDHGETPKEAAIREVAEEIGIILDPSNVAFYAVLDRKSDDEQTYQFVFHANTDIADIEQLRLQAEEISDVAFVSKEDINSNSRTYSRMIRAYAASSEGTLGYVEQLFDAANG